MITYIKANSLATWTYAGVDDPDKATHVAIQIDAYHELMVWLEAARFQVGDALDALRSKP